MGRKFWDRKKKPLDASTGCFYKSDGAGISCLLYFLAKLKSSSQQERREVTHLGTKSLPSCSESHLLHAAQKGEEAICCKHWESGAVSNSRKTHIRFQSAVNLSQIKFLAVPNVSFSTLSGTSRLPLTRGSLAPARR